MTKSKSLLSKIRQVNLVEKAIIENGGELTEELENSLIDTQEGLKGKADAYAFIMENLKERAKYWEEKAALLKKYGKTCAAVVERMRGNLKGYMILESISEIKGQEIRFTLQETPFAVHVEESELPEEYFKVEIVRTVDKDKIRKAMMAGVEVRGAWEIETYALRTYPNHSNKLKAKKKKPAKKEVSHEPSSSARIA